MTRFFFSFRAVQKLRASYRGGVGKREAFNFRIGHEDVQARPTWGGIFAKSYFETHRWTLTISPTLYFSGRRLIYLFFSTLVDTLSVTLKFVFSSFFDNFAKSVFILFLICLMMSFCLGKQRSVGASRFNYSVWVYVSINSKNRRVNYLLIFKTNLSICKMKEMMITIAGGNTNEKPEIKIWRIITISSKTFTDHEIARSL